MNELAVVLVPGGGGLAPGATLRGIARWQLEDAPRELRLRLIWYTSGKGSTDVVVVAERDISSTQPNGEQSFEFILPEAPYSFSGKLISLHWAVELVSLPGELSSKIEFILSPSGQEILLPEIAQETKSVSFGVFNS